MQEDKNKIEVILFTTGSFMTLQEIADFCEIGSIGIVKELLEELKKDYEAKDGSLTIFEENGKYKLSIKKKYNYLTTKLLDVTELDRPTQETLAVIAYKQPAIQAEVVKIRGNKSYDHIAALKELDFITSEKYGRTRLLKLTQKFFDYFDLVEDQLKEKFSNLAKLENQTRELEKQLEEKLPKEQVEEEKEKVEPRSEQEPGPEPEPEPQPPQPEPEPGPEPKPEPKTESEETKKD